MQVIKEGTCQFKIVEDVSKKTGNNYKALKVVIGDYEISRPLFINDEILYCINKAVESK